jgi:cellulose 1,4-beta-cellobiosidase
MSLQGGLGTVLAFDAAGNASAASSVVSATTSPISGDRSCTATYQVSNDWGTGFTANITVTNTGTTAITAWKVTWTWPGNQQIMSIWNAASQPSGQTETATSLSYNSALAPGQHQLRLPGELQRHQHGAHTHLRIVCGRSVTVGT